jgi:ribosomal protein S18 acetylase RimI-like enzyme
MAGDAELVIRRATVHDAEVLSAFARRQFVETFAAQNDPDDLALFLDTTFTPALQRAELLEPHRSYWLLEVDGALAGYVLLNDGAHEDGVVAAHPVELQRFYIDRAWHGRGMAARLMAHAVDTARALGGDVLWLGVWEENPRAIRFYEKQGFVRVGAHVFMVGTDAQTDAIMARTL